LQPDYRECGRLHLPTTTPLPNWKFTDADIPLDIALEAYNPYVPLDLDKSAYPIVAFTWKIGNPTEREVKASLLLNLENPIVADQLINEYIEVGGLRGVRFVAESGAHQNYQGNMLALVGFDHANVQTHLYQGRWRDDMHVFWNDFSADGTIEADTGRWVTQYQPVSYNEISNRNSAIQVEFTLAPGKSIEIPFYLVWYFPDRVFTKSETFGTEAAGKVFGNYYKTLFKNETEVISSFLENEEELYRLTKEFSEILYRSSYPSKVLEALSTQISSIKTNLIQVTDKGDVHGFEGVLDNGWCCPGTCTHVWNYEQALAFLFPVMERNMREIEFQHNTTEQGFQRHRSLFPLGEYYFDGSAAADGQMGSIVRAYREWKLSGDNQWLLKIWPNVKKALEYAWNSDWDPDKSGLMGGRQHNTYDISFFGPSSMTSSCYLAALKASSEMADAVGEKGKAKEYQKVYQSGVKLMEERLWNGSYFIQIIKEDPNADEGDDYELSPPNKKGEQLPKYQYGNGCLADQLLGQYLAHTAGLGYILDKEKVNQAIHSVYKYNFIPDMRTYPNVQRVYALNDESGLVLCSWPNDDAPILPFVYAQEVWTGVEYEVAASLIYSGFVNEGIVIVEAVQDRYDGYKRNPFEHDESGVHYARAMSSWAVLLALSGYQYDGVEKSLSFSPQVHHDNFQTFWSTGNGWGKFAIKDNAATLSVTYGSLELKEFGIGNQPEFKSSSLGKTEMRENRRYIKFSKPIMLMAGVELSISLE
jgi:non-lysosomal glucosylceramidase